MTRQMKFKVKKTVIYGLVFVASKWAIIALLYSTSFWTYWFLLLFPIADFIAAFVAIRYLKGNFKIFFSEILELRYPLKFQEIVSAVEIRYNLIIGNTNLGKGARNPLNKRLKFASYYLALIQVLEKQGESFDHIRGICLEVADEYIKPKNKLHKWWKKLRPKLLHTKAAFFFMAIYDKKIRRPAKENGFMAVMLLNKNSEREFSFGMDILECGICKLFNQHQANTYTPILCEVDKIVSSINDMEILRKETIAEGGIKCDFRFQKLKAQSMPA